MGKGRLEAFSDGVIAVIITIMVLEMKVPHDLDPAALQPLIPVFISYVLSYVYVGIYWNNHHHMLHITEKINGTVLWANLLLLFWLSLVPFVIRWMDETHFAPMPTASYGVVLALAAIAYLFLERSIIAYNGPHSKLAHAVGNDVKAKLSLSIYVSAIPLAFVRPWISIALYVLVAMIWFIPDRRIEGAV